MVRRCSVMRMPLAAQRASIFRRSDSRFLRRCHVQSSVLYRMLESVHRPCSLSQDRGAAPARRRSCRRAADNNFAPPRHFAEIRRGGKAAIADAFPRRLQETRCARQAPPGGRRCSDEQLPRKAAALRLRATATERISASSAASRDMMKPANVRPTQARCATTLRSSSRPSISSRSSRAGTTRHAARRWPRRRAAPPPTAPASGRARTIGAEIRSSARQMRRVLRLRIRRTQIKRLRRRRRVRRRPRRAAPPSRCPARRAARPATADALVGQIAASMLGGDADEAHLPPRASTHRFLDRNDARRRQRCGRRRANTCR